MNAAVVSRRLAGLSKILAAAVAVLLVGSLLLALSGRDGKNYLTVDFPQTNSLYKGSDVKILGVAVGRVEKLTPRGDVVRVKLSYEDDLKLPDDVKAVMVSPSIVGDRFVQLAPVFTGGAALKNNSFLPVSRTVVPVELDTIYQSLDDLSVALGPNGANKNGALSRLVDDTAGQLDGQGAKLNQTITNFAKLGTTLDNNKDELFGSLQEVRDFVQVLNRNDSSVRSFNDSTARVSTVLAGERQDLQATLEQLSLALVDVNKLVKDNRGELRDNVKNLRTLSQILAKRTPELEDITKNAPTALVNVALAYNPQTGTLDVRSALAELLSANLKNPVGLLCQVLDESVENGILCPILQKLPGADALQDLLDGLLGGVTGGPAAAEALPKDLGQVPGGDALADLLPRTAPASVGTSAADTVRPATSIAQMLAVK